MINHPRDEGNENDFFRIELVRTWSKRWRTDGLSNLKYTVDSYENETLFVNVTVDLFFPGSHQKQE